MRLKGHDYESTGHAPSHKGVGSRRLRRLIKVDLLVMTNQPLMGRLDVNSRPHGAISFAGQQEYRAGETYAVDKQITEPPSIQKEKSELFRALTRHPEDKKMESAVRCCLRYIIFCGLNPARSWDPSSRLVPRMIAIERTQ